jgi:phage shock protein A
MEGQVEELRRRLQLAESDRAELAKRVSDLEERVSRLEALLSNVSIDSKVRSENPHDRKAVTERVKYDWQD